MKRLNQQQGLSIITVLHDINLAARYSDRIACLKQGQLWAVDDVVNILTPKIIRDVFNVEVAIIDTPVGLQICPLSSSAASSIADLGSDPSSVAHSLTEVKHHA